MGVEHRVGATWCIVHVCLLVGAKGGRTERESLKSLLNISESFLPKTDSGIYTLVHLVVCESQCTFPRQFGTTEIFDTGQGEGGKP